VAEQLAASQEEFSSGAGLLDRRAQFSLRLRNHAITVTVENVIPPITKLPDLYGHYRKEGLPSRS
jgi:hypothetical protein